MGRSRPVASQAYVLLVHTVAALVWGWFCVSRSTFDALDPMESGLSFVFLVYAFGFLLSNAKWIWGTVAVVGSLLSLVGVVIGQVYGCLSEQWYPFLMVSMLGGALVLYVACARELERYGDSAVAFDARFLRFSLAVSALITALWLSGQLLLRPFVSLWPTQSLIRPVVVFAGVMWLVAAELPGALLYRRRSAYVDGLVRKAQIILESTFSYGNFDEPLAALENLMRGERWALEEAGILDSLTSYIEECRILGWTDEAMRRSLVEKIGRIRAEKAFARSHPFSFLRYLIEETKKILR